MKLNELRDNPGATKKGRRVGRGEGSGKGKTCGAGQKGQKARTGVAINGFEGGQNPLYRRLPKRGFTNLFSTPYCEVNVGQLQRFIDAGKLNIAGMINKQILAEAGLLRNGNCLVKLLGHGLLKSAITLEVDHASKSAITIVEKAQGKVLLPAGPTA